MNSANWVAEMRHAIDRVAKLAPNGEERAAAIVAAFELAFIGHAFWTKCFRKTLLAKCDEFVAEGRFNFKDVMTQFKNRALGLDRASSLGVQERFDEDSNNVRSTNATCTYNNNTNTNTHSGAQC